MKYLSFLALIIFATACGHSKRGSGNIVTEKRTTEAFMAVHADGPVHVHIKKGPLSVTVEADDNIMPYVETKVSGSSLKIQLRELTNLTNVTINVYVTAPELKGLNASAAADLETDDAITSSDEIEVKVSSGAKLKAALEAPSVTIDASSAGKADLSGRTKNITVNASSGGEADAEELKAESATGEASSGGEVKVFASVSVTGNASSGGKIEYTGGAANVKKNVSSGGTVSGD